MEKLTIDRSKWRTGFDGKNKTGEGETSLLNNSGYMCCLGFMCIQSGIKEQDCLGVGMPADIQEKHFNKIPILVTSNEDDISNTHFSDEAISINDNEDLTQKEREEAIVMHFATKGITVEFINDYSITDK